MTNESQEPSSPAEYGPHLPGREEYMELQARTTELERLLADKEAELETERELRQQAEQRASLDSLTGLLNQAVMRFELEERVALARRGVGLPAFFMFDLDEFKMVNDLRGHPFGDRLLKAVADMLKEVLREGDVAARMGGDEFGVLVDLTPKKSDDVLEGIADAASEDDQKKTPWERLEEVEAKITEGITQLFSQEEFAPLAAHGVHISYGSSIWNERKTGGEMVEEADAGLYKIKEVRKQDRPSSR